MGKITEGDLLAILKRNATTKKNELPKVSETLKSMKDAFNLAIDKAVDVSETLHDKSELLNIKLK